MLSMLSNSEIEIIIWAGFSIHRTSPRKETLMGYEELSSHHRGKAVALLLVLVVGVATWGTLPAPRPPSLHLTEEDLVDALLDRMRHPDGTVVSAETPMMWVEAENSEPIWNGDDFFQHGDMCVTNEGDIAVLISAERNCLLLRYETLYGLGGTTCPNGTLFSMPIAPEACQKGY